MSKDSKFVPIPLEQLQTFLKSVAVESEILVRWRRADAPETDSPAMWRGRVCIAWTTENNGIGVRWEAGGKDLPKNGGLLCSPHHP